MTESRRIGTGFHFEDAPVGTRFHTAGRTVTEADLVAFCNLSWLVEELFTNTGGPHGGALTGRVVPGALVYSFAEGLLLPMMQGTGLAFLGATLDVKAPTRVGETLEVFCEVIEARPTAKPGRGLVRTRNEVKADGRLVLVYDPLRMLRMWAPAPAG